MSLDRINKLLSFVVTVFIVFAFEAASLAGEGHAGWSIACQQSPLTISTTATTPLPVVIKNPKALSAEVTYEAIFSGNQGWFSLGQHHLVAPPGTSTLVLFLDPESAVQLNEASCTILRLFIYGIHGTVARATILIDFNLV